jgi:FSR family fosmidomycin resistance protein-like MFS transporter
MLFVFGEIPIASWLVGRYVAASWQSRVFALQYVLSLGVSAVVVPMIAILYESTGGFGALFAALAAAAIVVAAAALLLPRVRPAAAQQPVAAS